MQLINAGTIGTIKSFIKSGYRPSQPTSADRLRLIFFNHCELAGEVGCEERLQTVIAHVQQLHHTPRQRVALDCFL